MKKTVYRSIFTFCLLTALALTASAADKVNKQQLDRVYEEKVLYFQKGYVFSADRVIQGENVYEAGGEKLFRILSSYPSSASEIENYRTTSVLGGVFLGTGAVLLLGGLIVPQFVTGDVATINIVSLTVVLTGAALGIGGFWLMNSDIKQNFLYRSIWYYNESVLFDERPQGHVRNDMKFGIISYIREF